jgi:hypothetical protein
LSSDRANINLLLLFARTLALRTLFNKCLHSVMRVIDRARRDSGVRLSQHQKETVKHLLFLHRASD